MTPVPPATASLESYTTLISTVRKEIEQLNANVGVITAKTDIVILRKLKIAANEHGQGHEDRHEHGHEHYLPLQQAKKFKVDKTANKNNVKTDLVTI